MQELRKPLIFALFGWCIGSGLKNGIFDGAMLMKAVSATIIMSNLAYELRKMYRRLDVVKVPWPWTREWELECHRPPFCHLHWPALWVFFRLRVGCHGPRTEFPHSLVVVAS
jgi:hypothetical protein